MDGLAEVKKAGRVPAVVQLLVLLPIMYNALWPRLGPGSAALFQLLSGLGAALLAPLLFVANVFVAVMMPDLRRLGSTLAVAWLLPTVLWWTWVRDVTAADMTEARQLVASEYHCSPSQPDVYGNGVHVYCERATEGGLEGLWVVATNGPYPWSRWRTDVAQRNVRTAR